MKVKMPGADPSYQRAQDAATRAAIAAEERAAEGDRFYRENLLPRYMQQMDEGLGLARSESKRQAEMADYAMGLARKDEGRRDALWAQIEAEDSDAAREGKAGRAIADVEQALSGQRAATARGLQRVGVNPASGAYAAALAGQDTGASLAKVMAANTAREAARREGMNLRFQAAGLGGGATAQFLGQSGGFGMQGINALGSGGAGIGALQRAQSDNAGQWSGMTGFGLGALGDAAQRGFGQQQMKFQANQANTQMYNSLINQGIKLGIGGAAGGWQGMASTFGRPGGN